MAVSKEIPIIILHIFLISSILATSLALHNPPYFTVLLKLLDHEVFYVRFDVLMSQVHIPVFLVVEVSLAGGYQHTALIIRLEVKSLAM